MFNNNRDFASFLFFFIFKLSLPSGIKKKNQFLQTFSHLIRIIRKSMWFSSINPFMVNRSQIIKIPMYFFPCSLYVCYSCVHCDKMFEFHNLKPKCTLCILYTMLLFGKLITLYMWNALLLLKYCEYCCCHCCENWYVFV